MHVISTPYPTPRVSSLRRLRSRRRGGVRASEAEAFPEEPRRKTRPFYASPYDGEILRVALPALCAGLLQPVATAVDSGVVGQLGPRQLSGLGVGAAVYTMVSNLFLFLQFLVTPAVARAEAQKQPRKLSRIIAQSLRVTAVGGCSCGLVIFLLAGPIINVLSPPEQIRQFAVVYLKIMATSIPAFVFYQGLAGVLRGLKDTLTIFKSSGIATVVNVFLDFLFVFGFGWGVFGAALATSLCTYVSTGLMLRRVLNSGKLQMQDLFSGTLPSSSGGTGRVLGDGAALVVRTLTILTLVVVSSILISRQGPIVHSAFEICRLVFLLAHVSYTAFDFAMQALCASYLGKDDRSSARVVLIRAIQMVFCVTALLSSGLFLFSNQFARLFTSSAEVMREFGEITLFIFLPIPFAGIAAVVDGSLLGASRFKLVAGAQAAVAFLALGTILLFQQRQILTLAWTVVLARVGLSGQVLFSCWIAFGREYTLAKP